MTTHQITIFLIALLTSLSINAREIIKGTLKSSDRYYPGTEREVIIYIPDAYNAATPACYYVGLDGILCDAPQVMDSLIASGLMPVTVGIFLQPGVITDNAGNVVRYNRSNEFDMTTPTFAEFIAGEVFPCVEGLTTAKREPIRLSRRAGDGMIFGLSSGGIAAFSAAWHRPDLFSRVFCGVGTFVAMRGGNDLQAIVRKSEPRPLRVFLQDGTRDVWNALFGHWYEGNRMLATALDFAGYDARYDWSDCSHSVKRASEIFADVMTWMWSDWPSAPQAGTSGNDLLAPLLDGDSGWVIGSATTTIKSDTTPGGPQAIYPDGRLAVKTHDSTNCLWQYIVGDNGELTCGQPFYWLHGYNNSLLNVTAMTFDGSGNLWVVTDAGLQICDQNGRVRGILTLPQAVDALAVEAITINDGEVILSLADGSTRHRLLKVTAPRPGTTPRSQGQG